MLILFCMREREKTAFNATVELASNIISEALSLCVSGLQGTYYKL